MNILYATTRGWNIGDEAILRGCILLMTYLYGGHNKFIYNKNPYMTIKAEKDISLIDNSTDIRDNLDFIDVFVMAGTPSNFEGLNEEFNFAVKNRGKNIPAYYLGLGQSLENIDENLYSFLKDVDLVTVRDESLVEQYRSKGIDAIYMPCPALFCFNQVNFPKEIILVPRVSVNFMDSLHSITKEQFEYQTKIFRDIIEKYSDRYPVRIVAHYSHEIPILSKIYSNIDFSYNLDDYLDFYRTGCLVVSSRVHGCGIASSLIIPNIGFNQDYRQNTLNGFMSERMDYDYPGYMDVVDNLLNNTLSISQALLAHRNKTFLQYNNILKEAYRKRQKHA